MASQVPDEAAPEDVPLGAAYKSVFRADALRSRTAIITGGGSGICFRIAEAFCQHGADCVIFGRKENRLKEAADRISKATGQRCIAFAGDVRKNKGTP
jgi:peroxisomal 2,4-dienoyl-CoA reductase